MSADDRLQCVQCAEHGGACTWFRPISQTRTRRARADLTFQASDNSDGGSSNRSLPTPPKLGNMARVPASPQALLHLANPNFGSHVSEARVRGPTSVSHIMHSSTNFSQEHLASHNDRYGTYAEIKPSGRDAIIRIKDLFTPESESELSALVDAGAAYPKELQPQTIDRLIRFYFDVHAEIFPVVSKEVFISSNPVIPQLIYAMCGISAMTHTANVPLAVFQDIRANLATIHKYQDITDDCSLQQVQALLIFSLALELDHGSISRSNWNRLGLAIRKAQDLGLHREMYHEDESHAELRRQIWGGLIVADRWLAAINGLPTMIDLVDCDRLFPRDEAFRALIQVSILLGKVMRLLYTPTGITLVTNAQAESMATEIDDWAASLPSRLRADDEEGFNGRDKAATAGLLELLLVAVKVLFVRPFMRASYVTEALNYSIPIDYFRDIFIRSTRAIQWTMKNQIMVEGWQFGYYALFFSAFIQYQAYSRSQMQQYLTGLKNCVDIFESTSVPGCHARTKLTDITRLLYTAACRHKGKEVNQAINPVFGVRQRPRGDDTPPTTENDHADRSRDDNPTFGSTSQVARGNRDGMDAQSGPDMVLQQGQHEVHEAMSYTSSSTADIGGATVELEETMGDAEYIQLPSLCYGDVNINPLMQGQSRTDYAISEPTMSMNMFSETGILDQWNNYGPWDEFLNSTNGSNV